MSKQNDYDINLKILLIGNSGVGKSCLLMRFAENKFTNNFYNTIGVDFKVKYQQCNHQTIKLVLWDTAGQQRFRTITNSYYRGANGIAIVYDVTDRETFDNVTTWYDQMNLNVNQKISCVLIGNKIDMNSRRVVSQEQGKALARRYNILFAQTSAKSAENVNQIFQKLTKEMLELNQGKKDLRTRLKPPIPISSKQQENCSCCSN